MYVSLQVNEFERSGSFSSHVAKCTQCLIDACSKTDDFSTLTEAAVALRRSPDERGKYLFEADRVAFLNECMVNLINAINRKSDKLHEFCADEKLRFCCDLWQSWNKLKRFNKGDQLRKSMTKVFAALNPTLKCTQEQVNGFYARVAVMDKNGQLKDMSEEKLKEFLSEFAKQVTPQHHHHQVQQQQQSQQQQQQQQQQSAVSMINMAAATEASVLLQSYSQALAMAHMKVENEGDTSHLSNINAQIQQLRDTIAKTFPKNVQTDMSNAYVVDQLRQFSDMLAQTSATLLASSPKSKQAAAKTLPKTSKPVDLTKVNRELNAWLASTKKSDPLRGVKQTPSSNPLISKAKVTSAAANKPSSAAIMTAVKASTSTSTSSSKAVPKALPGLSGITVVSQGKPASLQQSASKSATSAKPASVQKSLQGLSGVTLTQVRSIDVKEYNKSGSGQQQQQPKQKQQQVQQQPRTVIKSVDKFTPAYKPSSSSSVSLTTKKVSQQQPRQQQQQQQQQKPATASSSSSASAKSALQQFNAQLSTTLFKQTGKQPQQQKQQKQKHPQQQQQQHKQQQQPKKTTTQRKEPDVICID